MVIHTAERLYCTGHRKKECREGSTQHDTPNYWPLPIASHNTPLMVKLDKVLLSCSAAHSASQPWSLIPPPGTAHKMCERSGGRLGVTATLGFQAGTSKCLFIL